ncbi:MAG: hypothetical protein ABIN67_17185 [Ferruginibacter sp.]
MKAATIHELKQELNNIPPAKLLEICLRLAKFKKDNKELLTYLLFESHDDTGYIASVKSYMDEQFGLINKSNLYFAKKSLRKILRTTAKYIRHTGSKQAEVELLLHFCISLINSGIAIRKNIALKNLYQAQLKKISKVVATLHEDLQYDYLKELNKLYQAMP